MKRKTEFDLLAEIHERTVLALEEKISDLEKEKDVWEGKTIRAHQRLAEMRKVVTNLLLRMKAHKNMVLSRRKLQEKHDALVDRVGFLEACIEDGRAVVPMIETLEAERDSLKEEVTRLKEKSSTIGPPFHAWRHVPDWEWCVRPWECPNCHLTSGYKTRERCPACGTEKEQPK